MKLELSELIKAYHAMDAIVELPINTAPNINQWADIMRARNYLMIFLESMNVKIEVKNDLA